MTAFPESLADVEEYAAHGAFPVVVKSRDPFERHRHPTVRSSTVVESPDRLRAMALDWDDVPSLILQEYIPRETAEDWVVHAWWPGAGRPGGRHAVHRGEGAVLAAARRVHDGGPGRAGTASSPTSPASSSTRVGFRGIADLDWRRDLRDGQYKLVDFNPRVGRTVPALRGRGRGRRGARPAPRAHRPRRTARPVPRGAGVRGGGLRLRRARRLPRGPHRRSGAGRPSAVDASAAGSPSTTRCRSCRCSWAARRRCSSASPAPGSRGCAGRAEPSSGPHPARTNGPFVPAPRHVRTARSSPSRVTNGPFVP